MEINTWAAFIGGPLFLVDEPGFGNTDKAFVASHSCAEVQEAASEKAKVKSEVEKVV